MRIAVTATFLALAGAAQAEDGVARQVLACFDASAGLIAAERCIGQAAQLCIQHEPHGMTTQGMVSCVQAETNAWDGLLNREYKQARAAAKRADASEPEARFAVRADQLLAAQRAWIAYRDAKCASEAGIWGIGTMRITSFAGCMQEMTATRTIELRSYHNMLEG